MNADLRAISNVLDNAKWPEDVFGNKATVVESEYRRLVRAVHPDKFTGLDSVEAEECFKQLQSWKVKAEITIAAGRYGKRISAVTPLHKTPIIIKSPNKQEYILGDLLGSSAVADIYRATMPGNALDPAQLVLKVVQSPADNDLLENEAKILQHLNAEDVLTSSSHFVPTLHETFLLKSEKNTRRRVNILPYAEGYVSLQEILTEYPDGLDFRDVVWMFKRLLMVLGRTHRQGVVHGAILPQHVLVHPINHGLRLVEWCYAVKTGETIKAVVEQFSPDSGWAAASPFNGIYPPEVRKKEPAIPQTDIFMAAQLMKLMMNKETPKQIMGFLSSCTVLAKSRRPDDAWDLHDEFDELLLKLVGKPTYRPLAMPAEKK